MLSAEELELSTEDKSLKLVTKALVNLVVEEKSFSLLNRWLDNGDRWLRKAPPALRYNLWWGSILPKN